jgi:hypothetical protein
LLNLKKEAKENPNFSKATPGRQALLFRQLKSFSFGKMSKEFRFAQPKHYLTLTHQIFYTHRREAVINNLAEKLYSSFFTPNYSPRNLCNKFLHKSEQ